MSQQKVNAVIRFIKSFNKKKLNPEERCRMAQGGDPKDLDKLVYDEHWPVRRIVARHGRDKDLDILVNDPAGPVRKTVAEQGRLQDLDILVHDIDANVREAVAKHRRPQDLNILMSDDMFTVRDKVLNLRSKIYEQQPSTIDRAKGVSKNVSSINKSRNINFR